MKLALTLVLATLVLICTSAVMRPASAVSLPTSHGASPMTIEAVQQKPQSKPLSKKHKSEQCFVGCWHSCWGYNCVGRCRCQCDDEKPDYCAKLLWGFRIITL